MSAVARTARSASSSCATGMPKTAITASPMNFSTVPPCRSIASVIAAKYRDITRRIASGSNRSPSAVDPVTSQKITVTVFLTSPATAAADSGRGWPQALQNLAPSGLSAPQFGQAAMAAKCRSLEQADGPALRIDVDAREVRGSAQSRHPLHLAAQRDHEPGACRGDEATHRQPIATGPVEPRWLVAERQVRLGHADRDRPEAQTVHPRQIGL